jgi:uncharacterized membrane-anchored protein
MTTSVPELDAPDTVQAQTSQAERPWPLVLLTAVGAWLAAIPLLIAVGMLLGDVLRQGVGPYVVGVLALGAAVVVLRARGVAAFVEQLAVPALLVGLGTLGMGVYHDFGNRGGSVLMLAVVIVLALVLPKTWLRWLLGAAAAGLLGLASLAEHDWLGGHLRAYGVVHGLMATGLLMAWWTQRDVNGWGGATKPLSALAWLPPFSGGWVLASLVGLSWVTGSTFLVGGAVGTNDAGNALGWFMGHGQRAGWEQVVQALSSVLVVAAVALAVHVQGALRSVLGLGLALVLATLAWWMPTLGAAVFALVVTSGLQRWRLAGASALTAAWVLGAFYYQLQWSLGDKALVLMLAGIVLGGLVWWDHTRTASQASTVAADRTVPTPIDATRRAWMLGGAVLLTVLVANGAIWQKQALIATGKRILIPLAPVDPRSLMQGDFMRLRFSVIEDGETGLLQDLAGKRPHLVMTLDSRGVASASRPYKAGQSLGADELRIELTPKSGSWVIVTDAWFFKEGEGAKWQQAKFGEFRVLPSGKALLVGMADAQLQPINTAP